MKAPLSQNYRLNAEKILPQVAEKRSDSVYSIYQKATLLACNYAIQYYNQGVPPIEAAPMSILSKLIDISTNINISNSIKNDSFKHLEKIELLLNQFQELRVKLQSKE